MNDRSLLSTRPTKEWHIRPLLKLKNIDHQVAAWEAVIEKCADGRITEKIICNAVRDVITENKLSVKSKSSPQKPNSEFHTFPTDFLLNIIEEARKKGKSDLPIHTATLSSLVSIFNNEPERLTELSSALEVEEKNIINSCIKEKPKKAE